jgi:hypothetical protein
MREPRPEPGLAGLTPWKKLMVFLGALVVSLGLFFAAALLVDSLNLFVLLLLLLGGCPALTIGLFALFSSDWGHEKWESWTGGGYDPWAR